MPVPDPDPEIRRGGGGGGGAGTQKFFLARRASVWSKNKGGGRAPRELPQDPSLKAGGHARRRVERRNLDARESRAPAYQFLNLSLNGLRERLLVVYLPINVSVIPLNH